MYDLLISGAGPAGLAAAIGAGKAGLRCLVLEKGEKPGPEPRGESMPDGAAVTELLGSGALQRISDFTSYSREYHSPGDKKKAVVPVHEPYHFFAWRDFIDLLTSKAQEAGAELRNNCEVLGSELREGERCCLTVRHQGALKQLEGKAIFACGGREDPLAAEAGHPGKEIACPTVKFLGSGSNLQSRGIQDLQFYMVPAKSLTKEKHPPAFAYLFPLGGGKVEAGLMLRMGQADAKTRVPDQGELLHLWERASRSLPGFSDKLSGITCDYLKPTSIQNRRLIRKNIVAERGIVLIGDSIGLVDPNGSSGNYLALAHGLLWSRIIAERLAEGKTIWEPKALGAYYREQRSSEFYRKVVASYRQIAIFEKLFLQTFGSSRAINSLWPLIVSLLRHSS